jgi:hypothetical protein
MRELQLQHVKSIIEPILESNQPMLIGHRGYSAIAPENTLPSFQLALDAGAEWIELDYHHSQDGVPMVIHDPILDRTTDALKKWKRRRIKVAHKTAEEIQTLDAGGWFGAKFSGAKVPTLVEALDIIRRCANAGAVVAGASAYQSRGGDLVRLEIPARIARTNSRTSAGSTGTTRAIEQRPATAPSASTIEFAIKRSRQNRRANCGVEPEGFRKERACGAGKRPQRLGLYCRRLAIGVAAPEARRAGNHHQQVSTRSQNRSWRLSLRGSVAQLPLFFASVETDT